MSALVYCRECSTQTPWRSLGRELGSEPIVLYWRCTVCEYVRIAMANVTDADGLCHTVVDGWTQKNGPGNGRLEPEEALGRMRVELWAAYKKWQPQLCPSFLAYANVMLKNRLNDWIREELGWKQPKAHASATSIDIIGSRDQERMGKSEHRLALDGAADRTSDLARLLRRRRSDLAREDGQLGIRAAS